MITIFHDNFEKVHWDITQQQQQKTKNSVGNAQNTPCAWPITQFYML